MLRRRRRGQSDAFAAGSQPLDHLRLLYPQRINSHVENIRFLVDAVPRRSVGDAPVDCDGRRDADRRRMEGVAEVRIRPGYGRAADDRPRGDPRHGNAGKSVGLCRAAGRGLGGQRHDACRKTIHLLPTSTSWNRSRGSRSDPVAGRSQNLANGTIRPGVDSRRRVGRRVARRAGHAPGRLL